MREAENDQVFEERSKKKKEKKTRRRGQAIFPVIHGENERKEEKMWEEEEKEAAMKTLEPKVQKSWKRPCDKLNFWRGNPQKSLDIR